MDPTLRALSKECAKDAGEMAAARGVDDLGEKQALLFLIASSIKKLEDKCGVSEDNAELKKTAKRVRKTLVYPYLPEGETNDEVEEKGLDLGQYRHSKVFEGNTKKVEKFARLMGGGKGGDLSTSSGQKHSTYAPTSEDAKKVKHEIEDQFTAAMEHKGKKGLGSK